jgi:putative ABC transport system permease protein
MQEIFRDISYSLRLLAKSPGFFVIAVLTLALGIGANTAIFSVINAVLLRPLPFHDPDRLLLLYETEAAPGLYPFAAPDFIDWQAQNHTLESMSLIAWPRRCNVSGAGEPQSALTVDTQANFFTVLGVQPMLGRTFATGEDQGGKNRVAVLHYGFWQRQFGGDSGIIGKSIELNAENYSVIGVMPASFNYPQGTEIWAPLDMSPQNLGPRGSHSYRALGRLKPGVTESLAQADLALIARRLEEQYPGSNEKVGAAVVSMKYQLTRYSREELLILFGAVALVLLVACANVANLLLIRGSGRRREIAIRSALGSGRWRVVRQLLIESILVSLAGGAAGLAAAWWCVSLLPSARALPMPLVNPVRIDLTVLLFTLGTAVVTGLLFGVAPALQSSAGALSEELKSSGLSMPGPGGRTRRLRDAIAVAEIAVSLALLVGAGLLLRSFYRMRNAETGVEPRGVLTMGINLPATKYKTLAARRQFFDGLLERLRASPGIQAASASTLIPLEGGSNGYITIPGRDDAAIKNQLFEWNYVTPDYFHAFGIPLLQGRNFTSRDEDQAAQVSLKASEIYTAPNPPKDALKDLTRSAVINRCMARLVWPNQDPIGRTFQMWGSLRVTVIGVVGDIKVRGLRGEALPQAYLPFTGALGGRGGGQLIVKTVDRPMLLLGSIRSSVNALDSSLALIRPRTMDDVISDGMMDTSIQTWLLGVFAAAAVLLATVGLYSVMAFLVSQRRHEIGIRMALGARKADLLALVFGHAAKLIAIGVVAGIGAALWLTTLIRSLLFGIAPNDVPTFAAVSLLLTLVAFAACCVPARRAMHVDPIVALRYE